jgi:hypothetical protein
MPPHKSTASAASTALYNTELPRCKYAYMLPSAFVSHLQSISPKKIDESLLHDPRIGCVGWKAISFTLPVWPGSRYLMQGRRL